MSSRLRSSRIAIRLRSRGFSLIEVMVGLVISLIGTFAMMQAFAVFEDQKRRTTSGGDAQQAGSYSLFELERQVRTGGSAIVQGKSVRYNIWLCSISARSGGEVVLPMPATLAAPFDGVSTTVRAIPVLVYGSSDAATSDVIQVISGNPSVRTFGIPIASISSATRVVMTDSAFGIYANEYLLASALPTPPLVAGNCALGLVSAVDDPEDDPKNNTVDLVEDASPATGFTGQTYAFDLGPSPVFSLFGVDTSSHSLVLYDLLRRNGSTPVEIADSIVLMKALYGVDDGAGGATANDGIVDEWVAPVGDTWGAAALNSASTDAVIRVAQIRAVRIAVVSRSQLPEREAVSGSVKLFPDLETAGLSSTVTLDASYRYKIQDTTIPLHNAAITKIF